MCYTQPFAKSTDKKQVSLSAHLREVADYGYSLINAYRPHTRKLLGDELAEQVERALVLAALTHDLGKAAVGFQSALGDPQKRWEYRHEVLSTALLLTMVKGEDAEVHLALAAVLTHHRGVNDTQLHNDAGLIALPAPSMVDEVTAKFRRKANEMEAYWPWLRDFLDHHALLQELCLPKTSAALPLPAHFLEIVERQSKDDSPFERKESMALLLTRGWLMAADHAVSAGVTHFQRALPRPDFPSLRPFQKRLRSHQGDAFLEAPTGSGKTIAALLWALNNRRQGERIFYLLPYQASIEAMEDTLASMLKKENVAVLHARALDYAFIDYFERTGEYEVAYHEAKAETNLNRLVHKPVKVATPFQLLKWFFGIPRFEIGVSEMLGGVFIFDEIHAYDSHVVALIVEMVRIIKHLHGKCLFMSATFPPFLKALLKDALVTPSTYFSLNGDSGNAWTNNFLGRARHRIRWFDKPLEELVSPIVQAVRDGKRVLVVANRVAQAQEIYRTLRQKNFNIHLLHSRFTRHDRTAKERNIIGILQGKSSEKLDVLVATQVIEVSLDVSFDTIFTEAAPVDDLLQRFGRVNRSGEHSNGVDVHVARQFDTERLRWVYDLERVVHTLDEAPEEGTPLTIDVASGWVQRVYSRGWTENEKARFHNAQRAFQTVLRGLRPLRHHPRGTEEFRGLFHSVEVLPRELFQEYDEHLRNKYFLMATQLLVPITMGMFQRLRKENKITYLKGGLCMTDARYSHKFGLQPERTYPDARFV